MRLKTNAKVNLFLRVVGPRPDGFHEVETVLHGVGLGDELEIEPLVSDEVFIEMEPAPGVGSVLPEPKDNIVGKVVSAIAQKAGRRGGARVRIVKHIPTGAGLGGGSANAAGALYALNKLWEVGLDRDALIDVAAQIGSDVPYCIEGGSALALGRGENLTKLPAPMEMWFVLGLSDQPLLTRDVYARWERHDRSVGSKLRMVLALQSGDVPLVAALLRNELEPAAFRLRPELASKKEALVAAGALGACMSGSGPTLYGIAATRSDAEQIARRVSDHFDRVVVVASRTPCIELVDNPVAA